MMPGLLINEQAELDETPHAVIPWQTSFYYTERYGLARRLTSSRRVV